MTKARTKGAKRRNRGRPPKEDVERYESGRIKPKRDEAIMSMMEVRCRQAGVWPEPIKQAWGESDEVFSARQKARLDQIKAAIVFVSQPCMGTFAGRAIAGESDVAELWDMMQMIRAKWEAYQRAIGAPRESGTVGLMVAPDRQQDGAQVGIVVADIRTEDERDEAAVKAWADLAAILPARETMVDIVCRDCPSGTFPLAWALREVRRRVGG